MATQQQIIVKNAHKLHKTFAAFSRTSREVFAAEKKGHADSLLIAKYNKQNKRMLELEEDIEKGKGTRDRGAIEDYALEALRRAAGTA